MIRILMWSVLLSVAGLNTCAGENSVEQSPLSAQQQELRESYARTKAKVDAAREKAQKTGNRIEETEAQEEMRAFGKTFTEITSKGVSNWVGVCKEVSKGIARKADRYRITIEFTLVGDPLKLTDTYDRTRVFSFETTDERLGEALKSLNKGDVVRFSSAPGDKFGRTAQLTKIAAVKEKASTDAKEATNPGKETETPAPSADGKAKALLNMARQYLNIRDWDKAEDYARNLVKTYPNTPEAEAAQEILETVKRNK